MIETFAEVLELIERERETVWNYDFEDGGPEAAAFDRIHAAVQELATFYATLIEGW